MNTSIEIKIILANVEYNKEEELKDNKLPIKDLLEVSNTDYPDFVYVEPQEEQMKWSNNGKIFFQPYLQAKINDKYKNIDITIKMGHELSNSIKKIITKSKATNKEFEYQKYVSDEDGSIYFVPPRFWKKNEFNKTYQDTLTGHYITIGEEIIKIIFTDGHEESMTLCSKIREEEKNFYKELLFDLISMHQQLCIDDSSTMAMAIKRSDYEETEPLISDKLYEQTKCMINEFYNAFWTLEKNAQAELKHFKDKKQFNKIKKISSQALVEHEILHKNKVTAISYREDFDTFEHRVIKTHLQRLKNILTLRQEIEYNTLKKEKRQLESERKEEESTIEELKSKCNDMKNDDDKFYIEASDREKLLNESYEKIKKEEGIKEKWKKLEDKLNKIYESDLMKNVTNVMTPIKTSNLFAYDLSYQKMYIIMMHNNIQIEGINDHVSTNDDVFSVAKLPKLYEIWCCLKLVLIFHKKYGFDFVSLKGETESTGIDALKKYIHDVLNNNSNDMKETLFELNSKIQYKKIGDMNINVKIWYNKKVYIDKNALQKKGISVKIPYLIPDIIMKISVNEKEKLFILDAKYRINNYYDGIKDLCEVAFQKYTLKLGHGIDRRKEFGFTELSDENENIDGSFIIHSNSETKYSICCEDEKNKAKIIYNPKKYLGAYPDKLVEQWYERKKNKWTNENMENEWQQLKEWAKWSSKTGKTGIHENRIGIITVTPKEKEDNLMYLIQMIMEQHFEIYQSKCWLCGSNNLDIQKRCTKNKYDKYYIKCQKCKKLTVETHCGTKGCNLKLGKHSKNYFAQSKDGKVVCPKCRNLPIQDEEYWAYLMKIYEL